MTLALAPLLAGLRWNPTVRGILFPSIMFVILCGSAYLILATNLGNRLGFLIANAALWGWIALMSVAWMIYAIGPKGREPSWRGLEVVQNTANAQDKHVPSIPSTPGKATPSGWKDVKEGSPTRGDASAAIDAYLKAKTSVGGAQLIPAKGEMVYAAVNAYEQGGDQYFKIRPRLIHGEAWYNPANYRWLGIFHGRRLYAEQIQFYKKTARDLVFKDASGKPVIDPSTTYTVVAYRDLGSRRQPPFVVFLSSGALFALCCLTLHKRDKKVMVAMASLKPARA